MSKKTNLSRRSFLSRTAAVTGGVVTLGVLGTTKKAKGQETDGTQFEFVTFDEHQGRTVEALAERIMPKDANGPGATDAQVVVYIDRALATHFAEEKEVYEHGLVYLDQYCTTTQGKPFVELDSTQQDAVLTAMEDRRTPPPEWPADAEISSRDFLIRHLVPHTMEGMFADPEYGGNYNEIGWKLINFPGRSPFGYDPPFGYYDMVIPEIEYPAFEPYTGPGKEE